MKKLELIITILGIWTFLIPIGVYSYGIDPSGEVHQHITNESQNVWKLIPLEIKEHLKQPINTGLDVFPPPCFGLHCDIEEAEHGSFIEGRCARVIVKGKKVAYLGEINPQVLSNWGLEVPVAALELNLSEMFEIVSKK